MSRDKAQVDADKTLSLRSYYLKQHAVFWGANRCLGYSLWIAMIILFAVVYCYKVLEGSEEIDHGKMHHLLLAHKL